MDREKVIKGLECCLGANECDIEPNEDCPYKGMCLCAMALRFDILALLKEQETVEPQLSISGMWYECPICHRHITKDRDNYCARCGRSLKWK